jgi:hypothetical protein
MSSQVPSQNEFFIYVPSLQKDELHAHTSSGDEKRSLRIETADVPAGLRAWVKVPLAGKVCVYVSLTQTHEEAICSN